MAAEQPPTLRVQLEVHEGKVAIRQASTTLSAPLPAVYERCALAPASLKLALTAYLQPLLLDGDKVLTRLVLQSLSGPGAPDRNTVVRELSALAATDTQTHRLWSGDFSWAEGPELLRAWAQARRQAGSPLVKAEPAFSDVHAWILQHPDFPDGPLWPEPLDPSEGPGRELARQGIVDFKVRPPLIDAAGKLRPTYNVEQWEALLPGMGEQVLQGFECRLWHRRPIEARLRDYLEVRGISLQQYRSPQAGAVAAPSGEQAALRVLPPEFHKKDYGGRMLLDPDPLLEAVYVQADEAQGGRVARALYRLLPTDDFDQVMARPADFLCRGQAVWVPGEDRPAAIQLPLDDSMPSLKGRQLAVGRLHMTRSTLDRRLQGLGADGLGARILLAEDKVRPPAQAGQPRRRLRLAVLAVQAQPQAPDLPALALPPLPPCSTPRDAPSSGRGTPPDPLAEPAPGPEPGDAPPCRAEDPDSPCAATAASAHDTALRPGTAREQADASAPRNHLEFSVKRPAGKPWRLGAVYRHDGRSAGDAFAIGFGLQKQASGDFAYSGDFLGFPGWPRRVQWTARAYSSYDPELGVDPGRPDERRKGAELRASTDLWLGRHESSAQLSITLRRVDLSLTSGGERRQRLGAADAELLLTRSRAGTAASERQELVLQASTGRADGHSFGKAGATLSVHRFVAAFSRWDLRARVQAVSAHTPLTEWVRFGGEDSVRGYTSDRALARSAWALQNEYWMPLPWAPSSQELASQLRRTVNLAGFVDIGGLRRSSTDFSGFKAGAGIGLRYRPDSSVTLRLDLARPLGQMAQAERRTRIHFTVTAFTPL